MPNDNKTQEFLQKLAPCIERGELDECVEEAARLAQEMGLELLNLSAEEGENGKYGFAYVIALAAAQSFEGKEKPHKKPSHEEKSIMIDSVMKNQEPQINADERRFVVPVLSSVLVLTDAIQKNERNLTTNLYELKTNSCYRSSFQFVLVRCFFSGSFMNQGHKADFAWNNNANQSKSVLERPPNMFDDSLKMRYE